MTCHTSCDQDQGLKLGALRHSFDQLFYPGLRSTVLTPVWLKNCVTFLFKSVVPYRWSDYGQGPAPKHVDGKSTKWCFCSGLSFSLDSKAFGKPAKMLVTLINPGFQSGSLLLRDCSQDLVLLACLFLFEQARAGLEPQDLKQHPRVLVHLWSARPLRSSV